MIIPPKISPDGTEWYLNAAGEAPIEYAVEDCVFDNLGNVTSSTPADLSAYTLVFEVEGCFAVTMEASGTEKVIPVTVEQIALIPKTRGAAFHIVDMTDPANPVAWQDGRVYRWGFE